MARQRYEASSGNVQQRQVLADAPNRSCWVNDLLIMCPPVMRHPDSPHDRDNNGTILLLKALLIEYVACPSAGVEPWQGNVKEQSGLLLKTPGMRTVH